jgi:uncharacterized membrane protein YphA (DoxX/SURF4 family)
MPAIKPRDLPGRVVAGAYILHEGLGKWSADDDRAAGLHATAAAAFPFVRPIPPKQFAKLLSVAEITTGTLLLVPLVPTVLAGLALTGFAGGLVTMYLRTPAMRQPGSVWPSRNGIAVSKDSWLLAMGVGMLLDSVGRRRRDRRRIVRAAARLRAESDLLEAAEGSVDR